MVSPDFIYGGFTVDNYDGNSEDFQAELIKGVTLGIFDINMLSLAESSKIVEEIGCMEVTSLGVSKITIKGITEVTILGRNEFFDEYITLGISDLTSEGFKEVDLLGLIEIKMIGLSNSSKLVEELGCKEDA